MRGNIDAKLLVTQTAAKAIGKNIRILNGGGKAGRAEAKKIKNNLKEFAVAANNYFLEVFQNPDFPDAWNYLALMMDVIAIEIGNEFQAALYPNCSSFPEDLSNTWRDASENTRYAAQSNKLVYSPLPNETTTLTEYQQAVQAVELSNATTALFHFYFAAIAECQKL